MAWDAHIPVIMITKIWTRAHFLKLEEEKLERLQRCNAPELSTRWVKQQIAYLRSNKPYKLTRTILKARVTLTRPSYQETNIHDMCVGLFAALEQHNSKAVVSECMKYHTLEEEIDICPTLGLLPIMVHICKGEPYRYELRDSVKVFDRGKR